jgi:hypothetical protein
MQKGLRTPFEPLSEEDSSAQARNFCVIGLKLAHFGITFIKKLFYIFYLGKYYFIFIIFVKWGTPALATTSVLPVRQGSAVRGQL